MSAALDPGEEHTRFVEWAREIGVNINGVAPAQFVGRGMGIVAARDLKAGECIVHVPNTSLISVASPEVRKHKFPSNVTVHGRLAAFLALKYVDPEGEFKAWQNVWPRREEFESGMPILWGEKARELLPESAKATLANQRKNLEQDYASLQSSIPSISKSLFTYTWLIVNTRTFYWEYPDLPQASPRLPKKRNQLTADDCYAMCPFMDYFNHSDSGCTPNSDAKGYSVHADRDYKAGDEIYVTYGPHTNDFLLVEYGFILPSSPSPTPSPSTYLSLDHILIPKLSASQIDTLKTDAFFGKYTLTPPPPSTVASSAENTAASGSNLICHRTQAALRLLTLPSRRYAAFVSGTDDGSAEQGVVDGFLRDLLRGYERVVMERLEEVEGLDVEEKRRRRSGRVKKRGDGEEADDSEREVTAEQKDVLLRRWKQIREGVNRAVRALGG